MIEAGKTYVVMGLLDPDSIAFHVGKGIEALGGKVVFTMQNERMAKIFLGRSKKISDEEKAALDIKYCDITSDGETKALFDEIGPIAGVVHSIAFSNPKTCLGEEFHTDATDDILKGFHISAASLATVAKFAQPHLIDGGGIVAMSFGAELAYPYYNWMGVNKAALEATVKALARRHGRELIRVNAVSAGPVKTMAGSKIPGFAELSGTWQKKSPLPWNPETVAPQVADAVIFLLGNRSTKITGQILYVDGGASVVGGELLEHEMPPASP